MVNQNYLKIVNILNFIMKKSFYISLISLLILEVVFLLMWSIGIFIKSEKTIKLGAKSSITILFLIIIIITTMILISKLKVRGWYIWEKI